MFFQCPVSIGSLWFDVLNIINLTYFGLDNIVKYISSEAHVFDLKSRYCFPLDELLLSAFQHCITIPHSSTVRNDLAVYILSPYEHTYCLGDPVY